ncbi:MAG: ATP-dependent zinc metalloprotease FtsH [Bacteroidota bacterium]
MDRDKAAIGWYIGLFALIWVVVLVFTPTGGKAEEVPYSTFRTQVERGQVEKVTLKGQKVEGVYREGKKRDFSSQLPSIGDPTLMPLLMSRGTTVLAKPEASAWWVEPLFILVPILLLLYFLGRMGASGGDGQQNAFTFGKSRAKLYSSENPLVTFSDVAGVEEAKQELVEVVEFLKNPARFHRLGAKIPKGVLLVGPPGTGKTLLARAVAGEAKVPFFSISSTEFVEMFVGVGASRVRDLFERAKERAPAILFVDEIDAVGRRRGVGVGNVNDEREQTLNQLLAEMDGFEPHQEVIVIAATNRPDVLDPALLRPGRFDRRVTVELPDRLGREAILRIHARRVPLDPTLDLLGIAQGTPGFSGADLANLVNEAALAAARRGSSIVAHEDFDEARDKIMLGVRRATLLSEHERRLVAFHEAGHALVAYLLPNTDPIHKVTIVPHGAALGVTQLLPQDDRHNYTKSFLLDNLAVQLGGRAAESLIFDEITSGAESDLKEMTRLARHMVITWGMSENLGPLCFDLGLAPGEVEHGFSEATASRIDEEVSLLVQAAYERASSVLQEFRSKLEILAEALLREESLDNLQVAHLIGERITLQAERRTEAPE